MKKVGISFSLNLIRHRGQSSLKGILSVILIVAILGIIGTIGYLIATPHTGENFTEFYILQSGGQAADYPTKLKVGDEGRVIVGIINREYRTVTYWVEVRIDGVRYNRIGPLELQHGEKREEMVSFTLNRVGANQKVEFLLYQNEGSEPYLKPLYLRVSADNYK